MKTLHEKASYIAGGSGCVTGSVRYNKIYERAEDEIGEVLDENERLRNALDKINRHPCSSDVCVSIAERALKGQTNE